MTIKLNDYVIMVKFKNLAIINNYLFSNLKFLCRDIYNNC